MSEAKQSQSRIFFEKKDEAFIHKEILKKLKNLSRMSRFTRDEAIQLLPKFALANLMRSSRESFLKKKMKRFALKKLISLSEITLPILNQAIEFKDESA
jgi:hypothetical protein